MKYLVFDIRALSLMRICVAFVILLDLTIRIGDLEAFYANSGATPLSMIFENAWNDYYISFHAISGSWKIQLVIFSMAYFAATMLLIGYRTQLFTVISWLLLLSLHNRNILILQGGDDLLRMTLFWGMFLPWGARYSCDRLLNPTPENSIHVKSLATLAYLLQISYVYTGSALLKGPEWHTDGTALYYVYSLDQISYSVTKWLYDYPVLLSIMTRIAYYFELLIPLFFFAPFKHQLFRLIGVALIFGFHLFNGCTIYIGLFFIIGMATAVGILPPFFMDTFERTVKKIKPYIRDSFLSIASFLTKLISWGKPTYILHNHENKLRTSALIFLLLYVLYWNVSNLNSWTYKMGNNIRFIGYTLRIDQNWGMFAPGVFKDDGWYIYEGITEQNDTINAMAPTQKITRDKPLSVVSMFSSDRWRKYSENFLLSSNSFMRGYFCNYYKRIWNEKHPNLKIKKLRIIYMMEFTQANYAHSAAKEEVLFECE